MPMISSEASGALRTGSGAKLSSIWQSSVAWVAYQRSNHGSTTSSGSRRFATTASSG